MNEERNLSEQAGGARLALLKEIETSHKLGVRNTHQRTADTRKRKGETKAPSVEAKKTRTQKMPGVVTPTPKKRKEHEAPQGLRKVPVKGDDYGCDHSGLWEMVRLEKEYLKAFVKQGGWLHETPCLDCAKNEEGKTDPVLDMSSLLELKGRREFGYYCNCGPVGHKMTSEDDSSQKLQWTCNMVLCMPCFSKRQALMDEATQGTRRGRKRN